MAKNMIMGELYTTSQLASYWTGLTVRHNSLSVQLLILQYRDLFKFYLIAMPICSLLDGENNQKGPSVQLLILQYRNLFKFYYIVFTNCFQFFFSLHFELARTNIFQLFPCNSTRIRFGFLSKILWFFPMVFDGNPTHFVPE